MRAKKLSVTAKAVSYLSHREHSQTELVGKLTRAGYNTEEITQTMNWLDQNNLQSNDRFAHSVLRRRASNFGNRAIEHELQNHDLSWPIVDHTEVVYSEIEPEPTRIQRWLEHKYTEFLRTCLNDSNQLDKNKVFDLKIKAFRALSRRGFAQNNIHNTWKAFIDEFVP